MLTALTRLCAVCKVPLPDPPAAPACGQCGRVHVIHHSEWESRLKWWLIREFALTRFHSWISEQEFYEGLLRDSVNGTRNGTRPNPNGVHITLSTPAVEVFPIAVERSREWKLAGSPITRGDAPQPLALRTGT